MNAEPDPAGKPHLTHLAFRVSDMDASIAFYRKYCRLHVVSDRLGTDGDSRIVWLAEKETDPHFVLVLYDDGERPRPSSEFDHLGYAVRSRAEVEEYAALARSEGCLQLEPTWMDEIVGYIAIVRDPDGNLVEYSYGQSLGED